MLEGEAVRAIHFAGVVVGGRHAYEYLVYVISHYPHNCRKKYKQHAVAGEGESLKKASDADVGAARR